MSSEESGIEKEYKTPLLDQDMTDALNLEMQKLDIELQDGWRWRLVRVKSGSEFIVQEKLEKEYSDAIAAVFIPYTISPIKRGSKIVNYRKTIHPGYIYCLCKKQGYHEALRNVYKQLEILLYVVSEKHIDLMQVKNMCNMNKNDKNNFLFHEGDSVIVLSGFWKDFSGTVISINNAIVKVQLDNFNKTFVDCDITNIKLNK